MKKYSNNIINVKINFYHLLIYIIVLNSSLSIFFYYFSLLFGGSIFYILLLFIVAVALYKISNINLSKLQLVQLIFFMVWASFYFIVNQFFLNYESEEIIGGISLNIYTLQLVQVISIFILFFSINVSNNIPLKINIVKIILFSQIINAFITLRALNIDPEISKNMATGNDEFNTFNLIGVSGYSIIYSIVIIFPLLIASLKNFKLKLKLLMITYTIFMMVLIYFSAYTTALIALFIGIILYIILSRSIIFKLFFVPLLLILLSIILTPNKIYLILMSLANNISIQLISLRLSQLANLILYNDTSGDSLIRLELYKKSIDAFFQYPLTGITMYNPNFSLSGHSAFLDILGGTGLLGLLPYLLFIWFSYKISVRNAKTKNIRNGISASYLVFCFIASINTLATSYIIIAFLLFFVTWYPLFVEKYTTDIQRKR
ncbi:hypothetical protein SAMN04487975_1096 [Planococcus glaciei]|uniref:O-antigen ligase family protein n=1 Tax=Planococcus glaciei TaxID=459472 RepID=UPI000888D5DE|nr:O-antigen ligase family protein [Planococcus glaciei]SDH86993.1 hypothetical protein SAMN04487975_1096 [Planococcus glaciei]